MSGGSGCPWPAADPPREMKPSLGEERKRQNELASELRHIAEEIRPLTDSVDSLYILLQHVWQNRDELIELLNGQSEHEAFPEETVFCTCCNASATSLAKSLRAGWQCIID